MRRNTMQALLVCFVCVSLAICGKSEAENAVASNVRAVLDCTYEVQGKFTEHYAVILYKNTTADIIASTYKNGTLFYSPDFTSIGTVVVETEDSFMIKGSGYVKINYRIDRTKLKLYGYDGRSYECSKVGENVGLKARREYLADQEKRKVEEHKERQQLLKERKL